MKTHCVCAALMIIALSAVPADARYAAADLENVPVARLIDNIARQVEKNPKDANARFNLARVHAMAYAQKTDVLSVRKIAGKLGDLPWFGYEPPHVPFTVKAAADEAKMKAAQEHLARAIAEYREAVRLAPNNLTARLGLAWCLEQNKDKLAALKEYRGVIEEGWKKERDLREADLGWHSVTAEAAGYLLPHLDAVSDRAEILTLKERIAKLREVRRPVTPIVVPLRAGLNVRDLVDGSASVAFDADGSGRRDKWTWITPDAAWLVYDVRGTGKVTSSLQLFGNVTFMLFWDNGYQALAALDQNGDGELTGAELRGLALWHDANGNGICDPGEVKSLAEWGIVALSCRYQSDSHPDCIAFSPAGVRYQDGSTRPTYDLVLRQRE